MLGVKLTAPTGYKLPNVIMASSNSSTLHYGASRNRFLQKTLMSVDEIGNRIGFTDAFNCRGAFRRWTGKPPSAYRRPGSAN
jgi:AraC-like DNA-binding protein